MVRLDTDDWNNLDHRKFLIYGSSFTITVDFLLYPLELLKTRVQLETKVSTKKIVNFFLFTKEFSNRIIDINVIYR